MIGLFSPLKHIIAESKGWSVVQYAETSLYYEDPLNFQKGYCCIKYWLVGTPPPTRKEVRVHSPSNHFVSYCTVSTAKEEGRQQKSNVRWWQQQKVVLSFIGNGKCHLITAKVNWIHFHCSSPESIVCNWNGLQRAICGQTGKKSLWFPVST